MSSTLINTYEEDRILFKEYLIDFPLYEEFSLDTIETDILIGFNYLSREIVVYHPSGMQIIEVLDESLFNTEDAFRLVVTLDVFGANNSIIPFSFSFDFAENGTILGFDQNDNPIDEVPYNPFINVLERPTVTVTATTPNPSDQPVTIQWTSTAVGDGYNVGYVTLLILHGEDFYAFYDNLDAIGFLDVYDIPVGDYTVIATAYDEPTIYSDTDSADFNVYSVETIITPPSVNNINTVSPVIVDMDLLPIITSLNVIYIDDNTAQVCYTTLNATSVDLLTTFNQNHVGLPTNYCQTFDNLEMDTLYTVTAIASDDEGNIDVDTITFAITPQEGLNSDRGILGLNRGKDMTFSVSPGVYTKETDLSGIAEPFVGTNGCFAGKFRWGPCLERIRIANEETLGVIFGTPGTNIDNKIDFFVAAQYLSYAGALDVVRAASFDGTSYLNKNAVVTVKFNTLDDSSPAEDDITILNDEHYTNLSDGDLESNTFIARFPGDLGNSVGISFVTNAAALTGDQYKHAVDLTTDKNKFYFARDKKVKYRRTSSTSTARSIMDLGDWLVVDGAQYQIKGIDLDSVFGHLLTIAVTNGGSDYTAAPIVSFTGGGGGTGAAATAVLASTGSVKNNVTITNAGVGYATDETVALTFTGGGGTGATGTVTTLGGEVTAVTITSGGTGYTSAPTLSFTPTTPPSTPAVLTAVIGYAVASITITAQGSGYTSAPAVGFAGTGSGAAATSYVGSIDTITLDRLYAGTISTGNLNIGSIANTGITSFVKKWRWQNVISLAPSSESIHMIVFDTTGKITGAAGSVIEKYNDLSFDPTARTVDGVSNYWLNRINTISSYIRIGTADLSQIPLFISNTETYAAGKDWISNYIKLAGGDDSFSTMGIDDDISAYDLFRDPEQTDAPIIIGNYRSIKDDSGETNSVLANYLIQNIAEIRKDSMVFLSCRREAVVNNPRNEVREIINDVLTLPSTSYAEMDSGWKYIYDRYNDAYLWVPTSGDHAGVYARTDRNRDPWYSGAGEQRGIINNVVKLAFNPNESQRDQLYANRVNPIVSFPGIGTMVYGDKTLLSLASGFNRIPTRRLFIVLEKTLANAARFAMFEFNDNITRAQVFGILDSYLRDVKGRRGVEDYLVDVSEKVNTPEVIANNQFKGRIYIKPKYSINFIELNFVNVGAILTFDEAVSILNNTI